MPGPRSAPNGNFSLTQRTGTDMVKSGKTALKKGLIKHKTKEDDARRIRQGMQKVKNSN